MLAVVGAGLRVCSVTAGVLSAPARSGVGTFAGVCSNYLSRLPQDGTAFVFARKPTIPFRPPDNPHVPMIMVGAGTGVAPFRGFLQERAVQQAQGVPVARSLLFFGCRRPDSDHIYADELRRFEELGVVRVENAFSRADTHCRYVQDAILDCGDEVWRLLQADAVVMVCGNAATMAPPTRAALQQLFRDRTGTSESDAAAWMAGLRGADRFLEDIWGG